MLLYQLLIIFSELINIDYLTRNFEKINYIPNNVDVWIYKKSKGKKIENSVYAKYL